MLQFQPDQRVLGAGVIATEKWQQLQVSVSFGVVASSTQVQQVDGKVVVKTGGVTMVGNGDRQAGNQDDRPRAEHRFRQEPPGTPMTFGLGAIITDGKVTGGSLDGSIKTKAGDFGLKASDDKKNVTGLATWTLHF